MMRILVLADIHGRYDMAAKAVDSVPDAQLILVAGDLTNFGDEKIAEKVVRSLRGQGTQRKVLVVAGNCDPEPVRRYLLSSGLALEGTSEKLPFGYVAGVGGGLKRAGITSFERTEEELSKSMSRAVGSLEGRNAFTVFLTHNPPYGTNADLNRDRHVGSRAFASCLQKHFPDIWICGHIHDSRCVSREDGTLIVNPGPCAEGCFAVIDLKEGVDGYTVASAALSR